MAKTEILLHKDEIGSAGIEIAAIDKHNQKGQVIHRDDHFMLIIQKKGTFVWELDFTEMILSGASISYVAEGQVHRYLNFENSEGWFVFIERALIAKPYLEILNAGLHSYQSVSVDRDNEIFQFVSVFEAVLKDRTEVFRNLIIHSFADGLLGLFVRNLIADQEFKNPVNGQKYRTVIEFKCLVQNHYKELKQVKAYALLLHITPLYLNEMVKEITGFTASYWIQQEIILEARRLLYYTDLDVKQIAYRLGYDDYAYFSRFFKKSTGNTASQFRNINHYLSNNNS